MNARHIGDDFTSLLYIAVTSSVFLFKLPIREGCVGAGGGGLTSYTPPPHSSHPPSTDFSADRQCLGGGGIWVRGMGYHAPTPQAGRVTDSHEGEG